MLNSVYSYHPDELVSHLIIKGIRPWQSKQILKWIYCRCVSDPDLMTDLSKELRQGLKEEFDFSLPEILQTQKSHDKTVKLLLQLQDGNLIEAVMIAEKKKRTLCVSTQVGCARDCGLCATGKMGLSRNLTVEEIVGQIIVANRCLSPEHITNLVFMGMGEPMDNLDSVLKALQIIQSDMSLALSPRKSTISTCGIVPGIMKLAESGVKTKLAVSLNSAIDIRRSELMPINKVYPLSELKRALQFFRNNTAYRVTLEYVMIPGFNMSEEDVKAIAKFVGDLSCKINLIPLNPTVDIKWKAPTPADIQKFIDQLSHIRAAVTLRKSKGRDISAACGQLVTNKQEVIHEED